MTRDREAGKGRRRGAQLPELNVTAFRLTMRAATMHDFRHCSHPKAARARLPPMDAFLQPRVVRRCGAWRVACGVCHHSGERSTRANSFLPSGNATPCIDFNIVAKTVEGSISVYLSLFESVTLSLHTRFYSFRFYRSEKKALSVTKLRSYCNYSVDLICS